MIPLSTSVPLSDEDESDFELANDLDGRVATRHVGDAAPTELTAYAEALLRASHSPDPLFKFDKYSPVKAYVRNCSNLRPYDCI